MMRTPVSDKNLDGYDAPSIPWEKVQAVLDGDIDQAPEGGGPNRHTTWLATSNPDGRTHVMPVGVWFEADGLYFTSGPGTRKARNLARDPRCTITVATQPFDLVFEGTATRMTDDAALQRVAERANAGGWPATVDGDGLTAPFSAPAAGPPPWHVYRMTPTTVFALGTADPFGATRFDFS